MSLLTYIKDVPLFSTVNEAVEWAESKTLLSYHTHKYKNIVGYMGGLTYAEALKYPGVVLPKLLKATPRIKRFGEETRIINPIQGLTLIDGIFQPISPGSGVYGGSDVYGGSSDDNQGGDDSRGDDSTRGGDSGGGY